MSVLDVFKTDPFSVTSLTDAINKIPFVPGRAGLVVSWGEQGVATLDILLEEVQGQLTLINPTPRGGPGNTIAKEKRTARALTVPHYQVDDAIYADEVQGIRAFGAEVDVQTVQDIVNERLAGHVQWRLDPTLEYARVGALKGIILNGDGSTLYNLFTQFGVSQETEIDFDLDNATPAAGALQKKCTSVDRLIAKNLGGVPYTDIGGLCGDAFWDDLIAHPEVRDTQLNTGEARAAREDRVAYRQKLISGILFENYRGSNTSGTPFIDTDKCHFFAGGVPGLFRTVYAPADYLDSVNQLGLPRYTRQFEMKNGKGVHLEAQMNALNYCTRPKTLIVARRT